MTYREHPGTCALCGHRASRTAMSRHLGRCLAVPPDGSAARSAGEPGVLFHLRVDAGTEAPWWLDVEIDGRASLTDLDRFLRDVWLECCGHLSELSIAGTRYRSEGMFEESWDPDVRVMSVTVAEALHVVRPRRSTIRYTYDFGTPTELRLRVAGQRPGSLRARQPVRLLARNEPVEWRCGRCEAVAVQFCTGCDDPLFCDDHARRHRWIERGCDGELLPVVDSPRMGACSYTGPVHAPEPPGRRGGRGRAQRPGRHDAETDE